MKLAWPKFVWKIGVLLYILALLAPPHWDFGDDFHIAGGLMALIETPVWALYGIANGIQENDWHELLLGLSMILGWASNFYIFFRLPLFGALFAIASPWILFIGMTLLENIAGFSTVAISFIPFYPWAIGTALIHLSRLPGPGPGPATFGRSLETNWPYKKPIE